MKKRTFLTALISLGGLCLSFCLVAQDNGNAQQRSTVLRPATNSSQPGLVLTNEAGQVFSVTELNARLQDLRNAVEQTLPMLTNFNQQAGATNRLAGAISGVLSGVLGKERDDAAASPQSSGQRLTNVLSALGALVSTNAQGAVAWDPATLRHLSALQRDLQPVAATLRDLSISTNQAPPGRDLPESVTPTGR